MTFVLEHNLRNQYSRNINNTRNNLYIGQTNDNINYGAIYNEYKSATGIKGWRMLNDDTSTIITDDATSVSVTFPQELLLAKVENDYYPTVFATHGQFGGFLNPTKIIVEARKIAGTDITFFAKIGTSNTFVFSRTLTDAAPYIKESFNYNYSTFPSLFYRLGFKKTATSSVDTYVAFDITLVFTFNAEPAGIIQNERILKNINVRNSKNRDLDIQFDSVGGSGSWGIRVPYSPNEIYKIPTTYNDYRVKLFTKTEYVNPVFNKLLSEIQRINVPS